MINPSDLPERSPRIDELQFLDDTLIAVLLPGEGVAVPTRIVCAALGLDPELQSERLRNHDVLSLGLRIVRIPMDNRLRPVLAILHTHIAFWLATITPNLVAPAMRPKLIRYQQELVFVLNALYGPNLSPPATSEDPEVILPSSASARDLIAMQQEVTNLRTALLALIQSQRSTEERLNTLDERVEGVADLVDELREIAKISAVQAEYILRSLRRLATRYQKATGTERNMYELLGAQFKISMGIPRYDALPAKKYDAALRWLKEKAAELLPDDPEALPPVQEQLL
ncbi:MAG: phage antirepressor N-terminal domain-containing protein [Oscillochloridaceae bacterium umkhey_bin13]